MEWIGTPEVGSPSVDKRKMRDKRDVIAHALADENDVHFGEIMALCQLKNAELEAKFQAYKGRVVYRGDLTKTEKGTCAVFIEQGTSASSMTAKKFLYAISRTQNCEGWDADASSAFSTSVSKKQPIGHIPETWISVPRGRWPAS